MPSCQNNRGEDDLEDLNEFLPFEIRKKCTEGISKVKMLRATQSLVSQTVDQLCNRNAILKKVGVTEKQLHAVLSLRLNRNTSPLFISVLIDREVGSGNIIKNNLGNYIMNPNSSIEVEDEENEIDSSVTDNIVNSINKIDSPKVLANKVEINKLDTIESPSVETSEIEKDENNKSQVKKRGRRKKSIKMEENEDEEEEIDGRSSSPSSQSKTEHDEDDKPLAKRKGKKRGRKPKIVEVEVVDYEEEGSLSSQDKMEVEEEEDVKPIAKKRGRKRGRKPKIVEEEDDNEDEGNEGSLSSQDKIEVEEEENAKPLGKKRGRKKKIVEVEEEEDEESFDANQSITLAEKKSSRVVVTTNNGRRVIRKITKYDPSEYYLTPLIRKKAKCGVVEKPKKRLKRGRPPLKPKVEAASSPSWKKPEQLKCYSRSNRTSVDGEKSPTPKNLPPDKKFPRKTSDVQDNESDDEVENETEFSYDIIPGLIPLKSKASMLKNECYICSKPADVADKCLVLACSLCLNIAHSDCVEDGFYKHLKKWRCSQCIFNHPAVCFTCGKEYNKSDGIMVMCDYCEEMFHARCHIPQLKRSAPTYPWRCSLCPRVTLSDTLIGGREDLRDSIGTFAFNIVENKVEPSIENRLSESPVTNNEPASPPEMPVINEKPAPQPKPQIESSPMETESAIPYLIEPDKIKTEPVEICEETNVEPKEEEPVAPPSYKYHRPGEPIPSVDEWTSKEVADYFSVRFGPAVGNAFLTQEIDGKSLKLMRRSDVVDSLGLQFGIALKVLYYVKKIQLGTNIIQELWA